MSGQIALPLDWPDPAGGHPFLVSDCNRAVVRHFEHWSLWPVMATVLTGPPRSGRSLLARSVAARTGGECVDDAEALAEEQLFHAWNRAQERRRPLVIVADAPPPAWEIALPDLRSRLLASPHVTLPEPDEALAALLIEQRCQARGLAVPPELIRYLLPRIERSHAAVHDLVDRLDRMALERRQRLTVPLARATLIELGLIEGAGALRPAPPASA